MPATLQIGQHLFTRDGRIRGNAIITGHIDHPELGDVWSIKTDFGNASKLTTKEIEGWYHTMRDGAPFISETARWEEDRRNLLFPIQSGRTTRMLEEAIRLASEGRAVYLVFPTLQRCESVKRGKMRELTGRERTPGIKFETPETLTNIDWHTMTLARAHPNCVLLVDHHVIEQRFAAMLKMLHRFDP